MAWKLPSFNEHSSFSELLKVSWTTVGSITTVKVDLKTAKLLRRGERSVWGGVCSGERNGAVGTKVGRERRLCAIVERAWVDWE